MSDSQGLRAELEARNAAMRENMNSLLEGLDRQTEQLKEVQAQANAATGEATSRDGLVTVRVNAAGIVTGIDLTPSAFRSTTPEKLSRSIVHTIQDAAQQARKKTEEAVAPMQENLPDLPHFFPGAPSIKDLMPPVPGVPSGIDETDEDDGDEEDDVYLGDAEDGGVYLDNEDEDDDDDLDDDYPSPRDLREGGR